MKEFFVVSTVLVLISTGASAQYNTECTRDFWGNVSCQTNSSEQRLRDPAFIDFGAFQRGAQQANQDRLQQELMQQQIEMQKLRLEQQRMKNDQIAAERYILEQQLMKKDEANAERNAPEWQEGLLVRREEGKSADGKSRCVYQPQNGGVFVKGKRYQSFYSLVSPEAQCAIKVSISKTNGSMQ
jgi:hypothetical protein